MPFDPFFSSANKHHFVKSEKYEGEVKPEVARILALPWKEREAKVFELQGKKTRHEATASEAFVLGRLMFLRGVKHRAIQRRRIHARLNEKGKEGTIVYGGHNTR